MITIEYFQQLDIRIGTVIFVSRVENSDKLLKFIFDIGESENRQIIAGMAEFFPNLSVLINKQMPLLLNIEPKKFRGEISHGMIIAADNHGRPIFLNPEEAVANGTIIK